MYHFRVNNDQNGATLVEILVAIALLGIMMPALVTALITSTSARPTITQQLNATDLLQQITEATRNVREAGWNFVATNGTYHTVISGSGWALNSGPGTSGNFNDQLVISDVQRNSSGDIVTSGGIVDPSVKKVVATVSWSAPTSSSISTDMYLSRWQNEKSWTQTTQADFNADTLTNVTVSNVSGGEVLLSPGQSSGTLNSTTFDSGSMVGFNYLSYTDSTLAGTSIQFQIASNNDNASWNYVGPDGTNTTFFTTPGAIPLADINGRYFRYQAKFTGSGGSTPILDDVTLTYSP